MTLKMHLASNRKIFGFMADLFSKKWESLESDFVRYFERQWLGTHSNWFEGAADYTPSTNNALESHNAVIKRKVTFRKRLPLNQFLITMKEMTQDVSKEFSNDKRTLAEELLISKETWNNAAKMHLEEFKTFKVKKSEADKSVYVLPSSKCDTENANVQYYKHLANRQWNSFDEFIKFGFQQFYVVTFSTTNWNVSSSCTCPHFFKQHICKHIIAIAVREGVI